MAGEDPQARPGYAMLGHVFAVGYTIGLMQALNIAYG
jgi:D-mannonate dehydratase